MSLTELNEIRAMIKASPLGENLSEMRINLEEGFSGFSYPNATIKEVNIDGILADLITVPQSLENRVILYLHGGGFIMGSRKSHRRAAVDLAETSESQVLLLEYRLAPEFPYPAAIEDSVNAYSWLLKQGFNPSQIAIAGDSAGGNLVISTLIALKEAKITLPVAAWVSSPYVNLTHSGDTITIKEKTDPLVTSELLEIIPKLYVTDGDLKQPMVSPIYADLSDFPPLLIYVGTEERLLDDALQLAKQAALCNVPVELKVWQNMIHCHHLFAPILEEGQQALTEAGQFLQRYFNF